MRRPSAGRAPAHLYGSSAVAGRKTGQLPYKCRRRHHGTTSAPHRRSATARRMSRPAQRASGRRARQNARVTQAAANPADRATAPNAAATDAATTDAAASINQRIATELGVRATQVAAAVDLLDGGATVPFIARYRKEVTGTLDDTQLRTLAERLQYLRELDERRAAVIESIRAQGKLDDALEAAIWAADSKARLEDIYLPYKPKRRTKAQIAREAGLEPLADTLLDDPSGDPATTAAAFVDADRGVADVAAALDGARAILVERFAENADLIGELRERMWSRGRLVSRVRDGKQDEGAKFADYFDFAEPYVKLPSHRILAMFRGEKEDVLDLTFDPEPADAAPLPPSQAVPSRYEQRIAATFGISAVGRPGDKWLADTVRWAWRTRILVYLAGDLRGRLFQAAEDEAVRVFAANLRDLLLAAPAGTRATMGLDPGFRTGVKVAVVDATGKVVATDTIYPHVPQQRWDESIAKLAALCAATPRRADRDRQRHRVTGDRQARGGSAQAVPGPERDQGDGVRGRRLGLLRIGVRSAGVARARRVVAWRGIDRTPAAGPAGRAREDRPEVHRCRPVPARSGRSQAVPLARRRRRGLCQRRGRRPQHRLGAAAYPGLGHHDGPGREHRRASRRQRAVPVAAIVAGRCAAGAEGIRAMRRLPAYRRRRRSAGRDVPCTRRPIRSYAGWSRRPRATSRR